MTQTHAFMYTPVSNAELLCRYSLINGNVTYDHNNAGFHGLLLKGHLLHTESDLVVVLRCFNQIKNVLKQTFEPAPG